MVMRRLHALRNWAGYAVSWTLRDWLRNRRSPEFHRHYERAMRDVLDACTEVGVTFWFIEGTLIALLRHGRNHVRELPDPVDDDIDLMIETATHEEWMKQSTRLRGALMARDWCDSMPGGSWMSTSHRPATRLDKLKLRLFAPGHPRVWTHVDFHSCLVSQSAGYAVSHDRADEYPFQTWAGRLPLALIHPLRRCACYDRLVPCVRDPIALLRGWHDGEYAQTDLAYPPYPLTAEQRAVIETHIRALDARGLASFAPLLATASPTVSR